MCLCLNKRGNEILSPWSSCLLFGQHGSRVNILFGAVAIERSESSAKRMVSVLVGVDGWAHSQLPRSSGCGGVDAWHVIYSPIPTAA